MVNYKNTSRLSLLVLLMIFLSCQAHAATYYVKNGGNDNADGLSDANAWATLSKINSHAISPRFKSGDIIQFKRGSVWSNDETIGLRNGNSISWGSIGSLTFSDYGQGEKPRIDGTTQAAFSIEGDNRFGSLVIRNFDLSGMGFTTPDAGANLYVVRVDNIEIDGIYMDGHKGTTNFFVRGPIKIGPNLGDVVIKNCEIKNIMQKDTLLRGPGYLYTIVVNNYLISSTPKTTGSVKIINNTVHDVAGDILQPANVRPSGGFLISGNRFYHFAENAIDLKSSSNVIIENNEIYRDFGGSDKYCEKYWPEKSFNFGTMVTHAVDDTTVGCQNITLRNNYIHSDDDYIGIAFGGVTNLKVYNNYFKNVGRMELSANGCSIHDNVWDVTHNPTCKDFIYCTTGTTSCSESTLSLIAPMDYLSNCKIFNNTLYVKSSTINYGLYFRRFSSNINNEIYKNIFVLDRASAAVFPLYYYNRDGSTGTPNLHDNLYFNPSSNQLVYWDGTTYYKDQQTVWRNAGHQGDIFADPLFMDPVNGDFRLKEGSPAKGLGSSWFPNLGSCLESWTCSTWSAWSGCVSGSQIRTRTCSDGNSCGTTSTKPAETETASCAVFNVPGTNVEGESGTLIAPMTIGSDQTASGGRYISTPTDYQGSAKFVFQIDAGGDYILEARIIAPTTADDSFYVGLDSENANGNDAYAWDTIETTTFRKVNVSRRGNGDSITSQFNPMVWTLAPGEHTFTFFGRESGTKIDTLMLKKITVCRTGETPPCDGCVTVTELQSYLSRWKNNEAGLTLPFVMEAIKEWKKGC